VDSFRHGGQVWALPAQSFPKVVAYNKALFDAAGVDYPALDWTLEDFLDTAVALTRAGEEQYGFVSGVFETTDLMFFLEQRGALLIDTSNTPADILFDAPATRAAVQWYADLGRAYQAKPIFKADWQARSAAQVIAERDALIGEGRAAMWSTYPGSGFVFTFEDDLEVGFAPLPQGPGQVGDYRIVGYYISAQAQQTWGCWEWISFLSGRAEQMEGVPARRALAAAEGFRRKVGQEKAAALLRGLAEAQGVPVFLDEGKPGWTDRPLHWLTQAFDAVMEDGLDVDLALAQVQHQADLLQCYFDVFTFAR
jgi:multiple sugar transport system substrate-binding protein